MTAAEKKQIQLVLSDVQSTDLKLATNGINKYRKIGTSNTLHDFIVAFTKNENEVIFEAGKQLLFDIKDEQAVQGMFNAINNPQLKQHQAMLIAALWEAGMDCKDRLSDLITLFIQGDTSIALEVLTVIENMDTSFPYDEITDYKLSINEELEETEDTVKQQLMLSLCDVLDNMTE